MLRWNPICANHWTDSAMPDPKLERKFSRFAPLCNAPSR